MPKSFTGQRRNFMMLFIAFLISGALALMAAARGKRTPSPSQLQSLSKKLLSNPDNWLAVSKMETAAWTSGAFVNALNPWGMQFAKVRPSHQSGIYQAGQGGKLASYDSLDDAVLDLREWIDYVGFPKEPMSLPAHIQAMKDKHYFVEPVSQYLSLVEAWQKR